MGTRGVDPGEHRRRPPPRVSGKCSPGATRSPRMKASAGSRRRPSRCSSVSTAIFDPSPQRTAMPAPGLCRFTPCPEPRRRGGVARSPQAVHLRAGRRESCSQSPGHGIERAAPTLPAPARAGCDQSIVAAVAAVELLRHLALQAALLCLGDGGGSTGSQTGDRLGEQLGAEPRRAARRAAPRCRAHRSEPAAEAGSAPCPSPRRAAWWSPRSAGRRAPDRPLDR